MEEAIDGWITTNILLEKFKSRHAHKKKPSHEELDPDMVGVLDLGGASTQVTFTCKIYLKKKQNKKEFYYSLFFFLLDTHEPGDEPIPAEFTTDIHLFDTVYNPYAHSYLCWGKNEALGRYRARLVNAVIKSNRTYSPTSPRILIRDQCLARGANDSITADKLFRSPCVANEKQQFNNNYNISSFVFVGVGNASQCRQRLIGLFDAKKNDKTVNCSFKQEYCTFDHTFQPTLPTKINFIGLSGYYYIFNNLAHRMF
jgi:hypothetical protein